METEHKRDRWDLLLIVWFVVFFLFSMAYAVPPLLPLIIKDFNVSYSLGGILFSAPHAVIAVLSIPLGIISENKGVEKSIGYGLLLSLTFGILRGYSTNFVLLLLTTMFYGFGLTLCFVNLPKFIRKHFPIHLLAIATGVYTSAIAVGTAAGISLTKPVAQSLNIFHWQGAFFMWGIGAIPVLIVYYVAIYKPGKDCVILETEKKAQAKHNCGDKAEIDIDYQRRIGFRTIFLGGGLFFLLTLPFTTITGWLPTYLAERSWNFESAALATSFIPLAEIPAILIVPILSQGRKKTLIVLGFLGIAFSISLIILIPTATWFACVTLGFSTGAVFPLLLSMPARIPGLQFDTAKASGILISIGYLGPIAGAPFIGLFRDIYGQFTPGFILLIITSVIAAILSLFLPKIIED